MRVLCQFEKSDREASQLRSLIEDLEREVLVLEANIAAVADFERRADPTKSAHPIAARTMKARRDNLVRTIFPLEESANAAPNVESTLADDPKHHGPSEMVFCNE